MTPNEVVNTVVTLLGGGLLATIVTSVVSWRKHPVDRRTAELEQQSEILGHHETTVTVALSTLEAVNLQYQELRQEVGKLKEEFNVQSSMLEQFKGFIRYVLHNWGEIRLNDNPPVPPTDFDFYV